MTVAELITILQEMPMGYQVEINNNALGSISVIDQVDCFNKEDLDPEFPDDYPVVMIQIEVE